jgi:hypothetical protein
MIETYEILVGIVFLRMPVVGLERLRLSKGVGCSIPSLKRAEHNRLLVSKVSLLASNLALNPAVSYSFELDFLLFPV